MAFREVRVLEVKEVLRLSREGLAKKRVARQLGLDVKAVRRYLELAGGSESGRRVTSTPRWRRWWVGWASTTADREANTGRRAEPSVGSSSRTWPTVCA
jgi:transposase